MAMRRSVRRELAKLRELTRYFLTGGRCERNRRGEAVCFFCRKPVLLAVENCHVVGEGGGSPINRDIVIHHINHDHFDDRPINMTLAHKSCHSRYHARCNFHGGKMRRAS
jgi:hypothetical protein